MASDVVRRRDLGGLPALLLLKPNRKDRCMALRPPSSMLLRPLRAPSGLCRPLAPWMLWRLRKEPLSLPFMEPLCRREKRPMPSLGLYMLGCSCRAGMREGMVWEEEDRPLPSA